MKASTVKRQKSEFSKSQFPVPLFVTFCRVKLSSNSRLEMTLAANIQLHHTAIWQQNMSYWKKNAVVIHYELLQATDSYRWWQHYQPEYLQSYKHVQSSGRKIWKIHVTQDSESMNHELLVTCYHYKQHAVTWNILHVLSFVRRVRKIAKNYY